jgi:Ni/Co efflux regulator RcnB
MKKFLVMAAAMLMFALPAANAQKVNTASELTKLEKADNAAFDAKKGLKASTWVARGKAYTDAKKHYDKLCLERHRRNNGIHIDSRLPKE